MNSSSLWPEDAPRLRVFATWRKDLAHINKVRDNHFRILSEMFELTLAVPASVHIGSHLPLERMRLLRIPDGGRLGLARFYAGALAAFLRLHREAPFHVIWTVIGEEPVGWLLSRFVRPRPWLVFDLWDVPGSTLDPGRGVKRLAHGPYCRAIKAVVHRGDLVVAGVVPQGLAHLGIHPERIVEGQNGVVLSRFRPGEIEPDREVWDGLPQGRRFLYHGYLDRMRGSDDLLTAFASMRTTGETPAGLVLAGPGGAGEHRRLREKARTLGVESRVRIFDNLSSLRIPGVVAGADVCVCPLLAIEKYRWSYPVKVYEYLAMGKVVVASDLEGTRRLLRDGEIGLLYPAGDVVGLREAMERLTGTPELGIELGRAGREAMRSRDWDVCLRELFTEVYERLTAMER